jgi:hypothetical protein
MALLGPWIVAGMLSAPCGQWRAVGQTDLGHQLLKTAI